MQQQFCMAALPRIPRAFTSGFDERRWRSRPSPCRPDRLERRGIDPPDSRCSSSNACPARRDTLAVRRACASVTRPSRTTLSRTDRPFPVRLSLMRPVDDSRGLLGLSASMKIRSNGPPTSRQARQAVRAPARRRAPRPGRAALPARGCRLATRGVLGRRYSRRRSAGSPRRAPSPSRRSNSRRACRSRAALRSGDRRAVTSNLPCAGETSIGGRPASRRWRAATVCSAMAVRRRRRRS